MRSNCIIIDNYWEYPGDGSQWGSQAECELAASRYLSGVGHDNIVTGLPRRRLSFGRAPRSSVSVQPEGRGGRGKKSRKRKKQKGKKAKRKQTKRKNQKKSRKVR